MPRRGPKHAGRAGGAAGDRVEERALAGAGRPDDRDEQRRIEASGPDQQVPLHVLDECERASTCGLRSGRPLDANARRREKILDELPERCLTVAVHRPRVLRSR